MKTILEQRKKALDKLEAERKQRCEEIECEVLEARNKVLEKALKLKFEERDATKTFKRAILLSEVFKERDVQLKLNEEVRNKKIETDLMAVHEQNTMADEYIKQQMDERKKNNELKRAEAKTLLKELKDREDKRRRDQIARYESDNEELQKIAEETDQARSKEVAKARSIKDKLLKNIEDNWILRAKNEEERRTEDMEEDMVVTIMAETKKMLARMQRSKELELMKDKQKALEDMRAKVAVWPVKDNGWAESDIQNAIEAEEKRYKDRLGKRKELANKAMEYVEVGKKLWQDEIAKRREILEKECALETKRRSREQKLLMKYIELRRKIKGESAQEYYKQLDKQCSDKMAIRVADRQDNINRHQILERQWHKEDKDFVAYANKVIEEQKMKDNPIVPLNKIRKDYLKRNNLYMDEKNNVMKKMPKEPVNSSRII